MDDSRRLRSGGALDPGPDPAGSPQTAPDRIRVAFVEDNGLVREGLKALLGGFPDFEVVAAGSDDYAGVIAGTAPDVALLGPELGNEGTLGIVRNLRTRCPALRLILWDLLPAQEGLDAFLALGVCGFVLKDADPEQLELTIRLVAARLGVIPVAMVDALHSDLEPNPGGAGRAVDPGSTHLTPREQEVITLIAEGLSNKAIARRLHVSIYTVKTHLRNVMEKLTLSTRTEIARYVQEHADLSEEVGRGPRKRPAPKPRRRLGARRPAGPRWTDPRADGYRGNRTPIRN